MKENLRSEYIVFAINFIIATVLLLLDSITIGDYLIIVILNLLYVKIFSVTLTVKLENKELEK